MNISEMEQVMIDRYNEMCMYRKAHKGVRSGETNLEEILDDLSVVEMDIEYTNET